MAIFITISLRRRSQAILSLLQLASVARDLHFGKEGSRVKVILESLFSEHYLDHLFCFQMFLWPLCPTDIEQLLLEKMEKLRKALGLRKVANKKRKITKIFILDSFISAELARPTNCGGWNEEATRIWGWQHLTGQRWISWETIYWGAIDNVGGQSLNVKIFQNGPLVFHTGPGATHPALFVFWIGIYIFAVKMSIDHTTCV